MEELGDFEVCEVTSKELVHDFILGNCQKLGWVPGKMDDLLFWEAGPQPGAGLYVGSLGGQPITAVGMFQHNDSYACVGLYFCDKEHRGEGYGFKTWRVGRASLNPEVNLCLYAEMPAVDLYQRDGFKRAWDIKFYDLYAAAVLKTYATSLSIPDGIQIKSCREVNFQLLKSYTEEIIGVTFDRSNILEKWITLPTHTALAAVKENGDIAGFAAIRETINLAEKGYRLAPVLADNGCIVRTLVLELAKRVAPEQLFRVGIPEINSESKKMLDEIGGRCVNTNAFMCTNDKPLVNRTKYFGIFASMLV